MMYVEKTKKGCLDRKRGVFGGNRKVFNGRGKIFPEVFDK